MGTKTSERITIQSDEWTFEDLSTVGSAIGTGSPQDGEKAPRPLPAGCMSACTMCRRA